MRDCAGFDPFEEFIAFLGDRGVRDDLDVPNRRPCAECWLDIFVFFVARDLFVQRLR